ncbi:3-hydroxyacyl-CoA dehydrogenase (plasmid) [Rhodococcus jostii RHA1]|uniref:L-gulonate 3-dehydrogenase n=1 Tax=Rhodococcus jostii (strain RHA1) TaxID=101510 RepID=Q0RVG8_RHOJR|nr:3-hydroxyacyl-CoA dehydrogenase NAD-binding domain-containing protein [Rhodococcus jostii]ABH00718.1 3-hydroxyacyl-CoA dehydrogenase [Rhodococcus jostii RHA1]
MNASQISVFGAGIMGRGIAVVLADAGHRVSLYDARADVAREAAAAHPNIEASDTIEAAVEGSSLLFEAVVENLEVKRDLFAEIERFSESTPIASNTSTFTPSELAKNLCEPGRLVIAHFFNPAEVVPLVEVVPSPDTRPDVVSAVTSALVAAGKTVVPLNREAPGFVANRLQAALVREAMALVRANVATAEMIDAVVTSSLGPRWAAAGPFKVMDLGGLDTWKALCAKLFPDLSCEISTPSELIAAVEDGRLGAKSGTGFYTHTPDEITEVLTKIHRSFGTAAMSTPA